MTPMRGEVLCPPVASDPPKLAPGDRRSEQKLTKMQLSAATPPGMHCLKRSALAPMTWAASTPAVRLAQLAVDVRRSLQQQAQMPLFAATPPGTDCVKRVMTLVLHPPLAFLVPPELALGDHRAMQKIATLPLSSATPRWTNHLKRAGMTLMTQARLCPPLACCVRPELALGGRHLSQKLAHTPSASAMPPARLSPCRLLRHIQG
mmetsp:Transcript_56672/g.106347  ORF Transcript_56672/g.106347 Transcript_56672/m.106347 type:complete len:205 (+) Transcript_56672:555-1169(+)